MNLSNFWGADQTTVKLTKETDRLHTVITFSAEPKQSRQLITMAKSVLQDLPQLLTITDFERVKKHVIEKNEQALKTAEGYLERLVYAVTYAQDPTYLSEADKLIESIRFDEIKELANKVYSEQNRRLFITSAK